MRIHLSAILLFVSAAVVAEGISAQKAMDETDDKPRTFDEIDLNNDGKLEEVEIMEAQFDPDFEDVEFDDLDRDDNGGVTEGEWKQYFPR